MTPKPHKISDTNSDHISPSDTLMLALEPRILLDAAGLVTGMEEFESAPSDSVDHSPLSEADNIDSHANNELLQAVADISTPRQELVFVDAGITDYKNLIDGISASNNSSDTAFQIIKIAGEQNGVAAISTALAQQKPSSIDAIHIFSHADAGILQLGNTQFDRTDLQPDSQAAQLISNWQTTLSQEADILLYGCNVAADQTGIEFVEHLGQLTQADVAASDDATGNSELGGDWELEHNTGSIESDPLTFSDYSGLLAAPTLSNGGTNSMIYPANSLGQVVNDDIVVTDSDDLIAGATIKIAANYVNNPPTETDQLLFVDTSSITGSWDSATGTLTLSGADTVANYQAALRSVQYLNDAASPTDTDRTIIFTVKDGSSTSNSIITTIRMVSELNVPVSSQTYFVPGDPNVIWEMFTQLQSDYRPDLTSATYKNAGLHSVVSMAATEDNTIIYYDHWEDGYDASPLVPGGTTEKITLTAGEEKTLESGTGGDTPSIAIPRDSNDLRYDGGDRIYKVGGPITVSYAVWPERIGTVMGLAWEIYPAKPFNKEYTIPIGEDIAQPTNVFQDVHALVQASADGTTVGFDVDGDGNPDTVIDTDLNGSPDTYQVTLNQGQTTQLLHVQAGTKIISSQPVQVQLITGDTSNFETRGFSITPDVLRTNDYYSPVDSQDGIVPTDFYLYNPNDDPITVKYESKGGVSGTINIASGESISYKEKTGNYAPDDAALHFWTDDYLDQFWGIGVVDIGATRDWGFSLVPSYILGNDYTLGWAPHWGPTGTPSADLTGSGLYVTPVSDNTTIYWDYERDGVVDGQVTLDRFDTYVVYDNTDDSN